VFHSGTLKRLTRSLATAAESVLANANSISVIGERGQLKVLQPRYVQRSLYSRIRSLSSHGKDHLRSLARTDGHLSKKSLGLLALATFLGSGD